MNRPTAKDEVLDAFRELGLEIATSSIVPARAVPIVLEMVCQRQAEELQKLDGRRKAAAS